MVAYEPITTEEFDRLPSNAARKPSQWDEVLTALAAGQAVRIPGDQKAQRGAKIALGRLAKQRNITLDYRQTPEGLAVRQSQAKQRASSEAPVRRGRGRPARRTSANGGAE